MKEQEKGKNFVTRKLSITKSEIFWLGKPYLWLVSGCFGCHRPIITNACLCTQSLYPFFLEFLKCGILMFPAEAAYLPVSTFWERLLILEVIFIRMPSFCICLCIWEMRNVSSRMRCELQVEIFLAIYLPPVVWSRQNPRHAVGCPGIPWRHAPACDVTLSAFDVTPKMQWRTVKKKFIKPSWSPGSVFFPPRWSEKKRVWLLVHYTTL